MQSFIYHNLSEYSSFWPSSPGKDRLGSEQESKGRNDLSLFHKDIQSILGGRMKGDGVKAGEKKNEMELVKKEKRRRREGLGLG